MFPAKIYVGQIAVVLGIVVVSTWGATQWTAAALGYQQRLGEPWFLIIGYRVYLPWRLFEWWFAYEAYAPEIFEEGGAIAAGGGIAGALFAIVNSVWRARQSQLVTTYGSARWATAKEIKAAGLFASKGVFLGRLENNYLRHDGPEHVMCFAPTRSGKGVGLVLPTLLSWTSSAVVHDIKGENWELTSGWRSTFSHCLLFNPTDERSARSNPLLEVRKGAAEVRDVQNIADILVDPEGALERRTHWEKTSHSLLVGVILHLLYAEEKKTLTRVTEILADPAQSFEKTLRIMLATNHLGTEAEPKVHPVVAATARELLNKSENERSGVLSTAVSFLGLYRDPVVSRNTESCDWRIAHAASARIKPVRHLVVRGISDRGDENKKKLDKTSKNGWRRYCVRNATTFLQALLSWDGFLECAGLADGRRDTERAAAIRGMIGELRDSPGCAWAAGVALGIYTHGPSIQSSGNAVPLDVAQLREIDPRFRGLMEAIEPELTDGFDQERAARTVRQAYGKYRRSIASASAEAMIRDLDEVVTQIVFPSTGTSERQASPVLVEADRVYEAQGAEEVGSELPGDGSQGAG